MLPSSVNAVTGPRNEVGTAISDHEGISKLTLTGSKFAGVQTLKGAAESITPVSVELGDKSPNTVFPDADLDKAIEGTMVSNFSNSD